MEQALHRVWARRGWVAWLLVPLSLAYRTLLALRRTLYRLGLLEAASVPVPVIVVGNVIAGGAGKTPVVMALVQYLQQRGLHPGVVSRGYGRSLTGCREVLPQSLMHEVGDEALLIQHRCHVPVFVAERRIQAAQALLERHPRTDVLLCDDGLQHLALHRDIDICVFDQRGLGNGWVLPAGPLREPWPRAVDLVLHPPTTTEPSGYTDQRELAAYALQREGSRLT
ncbi:MAG: tetraacyldisaccharide 4'-kinase, partial [Betaproteobacteria bacterium]